MNNKIISIIFTMAILLSSTSFAQANTPGVRGDIPSVGTENRDLTFRMKKFFLDTRANRLQVTFRTATKDSSGNPFSVSYSEATGNLFVARKRRKATIVLPFVESDTRGELVICGGRVSCDEPYVFPLLILEDLTLSIVPQNPDNIIPEEFGNAAIGAIPGPTGPEGPAGPAGATGATGAQGPAGTAGSGLNVGGTIDVNGLNTLAVSGVNYITLTDSNTGTTDVIQTITGGSRGQVLYVELNEFIQFQVNNTGAPNSIFWGRGAANGSNQPVTSASGYRFVELMHNGNNWFLVGRNSN